MKNLIFIIILFSSCYTSQIGKPVETVYNNNNLNAWEEEICDQHNNIKYYNNQLIEIQKTAKQYNANINVNTIIEIKNNIVLTKNQMNNNIIDYEKTYNKKFSFTICK